MKFLFIFYCVMSLASFTVVAQAGNEPSVVSDYIINVELDIENKKLHGQTTLSWKNPSDDLIQEMYFHLYYNAFRNTESTFFKDDNGIPDFLSTQIDEVCGWGWSDITKIVDDSGNDLTHSLSFVHTTDDNDQDMSVAKIYLNEPVKGKASITLTITWEARIPKTMPRTGYNKDFYFFAQWFPKLGVYEPAGMRGNTIGKWNCHQYHATGEYYSDFSNYDVTMSVPHDFIVASSGKLISKNKHETLTDWNYQVDNVIDFTWSASPHFIKKTMAHQDTEINFYTYPYKQAISERYFNTLKFCLDFLGEHLGPYPYPTLTVLDPPIHGIYTGGMEYPTFITSISFSFFPPGFRTPETLVTHEFIHQYFMQMVASHEVEEPWLDEGLTTYWESRILDSLFSPNNSMICFAGFSLGTREYNRAEFLNSPNPKIASIDTKAYDFDFGGYGPIAYNKTAIMLQTLEGIIGQSTMDKIWKEYFKTWQYKHPFSQDFIDIVNKVVVTDLNSIYPTGMNWYFEQVLYGTEECDYAVAKIEKLEPLEKRGFYQDLDNCEKVELPSDSTLSYEIILHRLGEVKLPVDVLVRFDNNSSEWHSWDGVNRAHRLLVMSPNNIESVTIDPNRKIYLDKNFLNNSMKLEENELEVSKLTTALINNIQHVVESLTLLF